VFSRLFPNLKFSSAVPTTVVVFRNEKSFKPFKPVADTGKTAEWVAGYFQPSEDGNYIVLSIEGERQQTYQTIFHEYVHFLINNSFGRAAIPPWFNEGLAEYYDQFSIEDDQKVQLGGLNQNHLLSLKQSKLIPFETFFKIAYYSLHRQGSHSANIFYAQSWAFMHFLIHANGGARSKQVNTFMQSLLNGDKAETAFQKAFQTDFAAIEKELRSYVEQRSFRGTLVTFGQKLVFDNDISSSPLPEFEANAYLGDLMLKSERLSEAETLLNSALASDSNSRMANTSLGMVKMRQRKFPEARKFLEKVIAGKDPGHLVFYRYAYLLSRESMDEQNWVSGYPDEIAKSMRDALNKAIELSPTFPESYRLLAFISIVRNDRLDEAVGFIKKAIALSPGNQEYQLHLASLYIRKDEFDQAKKIADAIFATAQEDDVRSHAESVLRNMDVLRAQAERRKEFEAREAKNGGRTYIIVDQDKPLTEAEIEAMKRKAEAAALNSALRKPKPNEKRMLVHLTAIECKGSSIFFAAKENGSAVRFTAKNFAGLDLTSFVETENTEIGCGAIKKETWVIITYIPGENPKLKTAGELTALELVPAWLKTLEKQEEPYRK
ncbi:MAG: tetratricopeptide repeat protein, partial [Blastocatellia bacterium]